MWIDTTNCVTSARCDPPYNSQVPVAAKLCLLYFTLLDIYITCDVVLFGKDSVDRVEQPVKGCAIMSKRAVDVMSCETNRLLVLTASCIIPVSYCVPRKVMLNSRQCGSVVLILYIRTW